MDLTNITKTCWKCVGFLTLKERREAAFASFTNKLVSSSRFQHLFPLKEAGPMELRNTKKYTETFARSNRLYNSPVYSMRRYLNGKED